MEHSGLPLHEYLDVADPGIHVLVAMEDNDEDEDEGEWATEVMEGAIRPGEAMMSPS